MLKPNAPFRLPVASVNVEARHREARCAKQVKSGAELAAAIKAAKNGRATGATAGFTCEESGVRIAVTLAPGNGLAAAAAALKIVLEDLRKHGTSGLDHWKCFLAKKKAHAQKAAELEAAQKTLNQHAQSNANGGN